MGSSPSSYDFDLIVIGAGSGGLTAAKFAAEIGARVALVERSRLGGDCTWTGCVPSKALLHVAKIAHHARTGGEGTGVHPSGAPSVDMAEVRDYVHGRIGAVYQHETPGEIEAKGVVVFANTHAMFVDAHTIRLSDGPVLRAEGEGEGKREKETSRERPERITSSKFCICTGARPVIPPLAGLQDGTVPYLTYEGIFDEAELPPRLCVIGAGPIGAEMAQAFARLGSRVTMVASKLLRKEHDDARAVVARVFRDEGITMLESRAASAAVADGGASGGPIRVTTKDGHEVVCDRLLVAAGRVPNVEGLGLEAAGVALGKHRGAGIEVNGTLQTSVPHIYAAGDCCGSEQFTHYAGWQAFQAVRNALLPGTASGRSSLVPRCTFVDPELAQVGLTMEEATARYGMGGALELRRDAAHNDRAVCDSDAPGGFIAVVVRAGGSGRVLGARVVMARAGELINELAVAIHNKLTIRQVASTIHAYPSYGFALQQLAADYATTAFLASSSGRCARSLGLCCGSYHKRKKDRRWPERQAFLAHNPGTGCGEGDGDGDGDGVATSSSSSSSSPVVPIPQGGGGSTDPDLEQKRK